MEKYDTKKEQCTQCERPVSIKVSKANKPYMVNKDGSYHIVFNNGEHCAGNQAEADYLKTHESLEGYIGKSGSPPEETGKSEPPPADEAALQDNKDYQWFEEHWPIAKACALKMGAKPDSTDARIAAAGVMHDFAALEIAKALVYKEA